MINKHFFSGILFVFLLTLIPRVNAQETKAVFFSENGQLFSIYLNGKLMNDYPMNQVKVDGLILKDYQLKFVWQDISLSKIETILKVKIGRENVFVAFEEKGEMRIDLYAKAKKGMYSPTSLPLPAERNGYAGELGCRKALENSAFESNLSQLKSTNYPADKVSFVRTIIVENCLTVDQLKQLINQLDYESDKVDLLKLSYSYVFDRDNFSSLANIFEYPGAYDEIQTYIDEQLKN